MAALTDGSMMQARYVLKIASVADGWIADVDAAGTAELVQRLGAGRERVEDEINLNVGIRFLKKPGEAVRMGETMAVVYADDVTVGAGVGRDLLQVVKVSPHKWLPEPLVYGIVDERGFIGGESLGF